ncbi:hypothetical protein DEM27_23755 [Metarhizobium album]|uniref:Uncharacterized protein n=1 Tax=Metarhizobium album TaxID=2182425 RepID=A0A2U2DKY2_9HYPH|nr:hypothetical protein [Rhizobium album]PWE53930.1 hypothetical protein DEM27_23755 [Rhizobium album]
MVARSERQSAKQQIRDDAKGQFAKPLKGETHDGVASAKPTVITGSDDATAKKIPPGQKGPEKEWSVNYDPKNINEGRYRG